MKRTYIYLNGFIYDALEVTKSDLVKIGSVKIPAKAEMVLSHSDDDDFVGYVFGNIDNILCNLNLPYIESNLQDNDNKAYGFILKNDHEVITPNTNITLGQATKLLLAGETVMREGWNGKGMWLVYVPGSDVEVREKTPYWKAGLRGKLHIEGHIDMFTAQGNMQPGWLASQADMVAKDWRWRKNVIEL